MVPAKLLASPWVPSSAPLSSTPEIGFLIGTVCWFLCGVGTVLLIPRELPANRGEGTEKFDLKQTLMQFRPPTTCF